ncbi:MAG TPA: flagellar basal body rod C-terminal domain-containing protein, partial [Verrucomicrobiae bacterium]
TFDPNNSAPITVGPDGQVSQGPDIKGKIAVTEFGNVRALTSAGSNFFHAPTLAQARPATATTVRQGFVEASNTSPTLAMASLITSMRMFETNQKVMVMQSDRMSKAISELSGTT